MGALMWWKAVARGALDLLAPHRCPGCDEVLDWGELGFCGACAPLVERLPHGPAAYSFGGPLAEGIRGLKFHGRVDYLEALSALWLETAARHAGHVDVVVPIPLHARRMRTRGFNQTELLAAPIAKSLGVPLDATRMRRTRDTPPQANLRQVDRDGNVRGAFVAERDGARRRVLLVDDVRTTGATLRAASGALYRAGASNVRIFALAGVPDGIP